MPLSERAQHRIAIAVGTLAASTVAVILRFWCKLDLKEGLHADDFFIVITQVIWYIYVGLVIWDSTTGSHGQDVGVLAAALQANPTPAALNAIQVALKVVWAAAFLGFIAYYTIKMAILLLCRRIFSTAPYRKATTLLMTLTTIYFIVVVILHIVHCLPIRSFWTPSVKGHCFNFHIFNFVAGIVDIILDALILALPIWAVSHTQMPVHFRVLVCAIFLVGGFAIITNILRLKYTYRPHAQYVSLANAELWLDVHIFVATTCACLPVYKPLRRRGALLWTTVKSWYASSIHLRKSTRTSQKKTEESRDRIGSLSELHTSGNSDLDVIGLSNYPSKNSDENSLNAPDSGHHTMEITQREPRSDEPSQVLGHQIAVTKQYQVL
ncbi:hypothetical protein GGR57DRAFT_498452 [Xylariaceae sp. FL1272]|nr:hypothetical protein GGR57DRAFT_498452 [Xylariaceae sp. FL1272]